MIQSLRQLYAFDNDFVVPVEVGNQPDFFPTLKARSAKIDRATDDKSRNMIPIDQWAFYEFARNIYAIFQTRETGLLGYFMLRGGVIFPS